MMDNYVCLPIVYDFFPSCCSLDPTNELARQGIERVENGESGTDNAFDVEMEHSVSEVLTLYARVQAFRHMPEVQVFHDK